MKNIKLLITSVLTACFTVTFTSCKDKCPPCGSDYLEIPQEMKDWALFKDGSWWVYRLAEDTTVLDTVRVSPNSLRDFRSNKSKCEDNNSLSTQCSETLTYDLQHSNKQYFGHLNDSVKSVSDEINLYYPPGEGVCMHYINGAATGTSGRVFCIDPIVVGENYGSFTLIDTFNNQMFNNIFIKKGFYKSPPPQFIPKCLLG